MKETMKEEEFKLNSIKRKIPRIQQTSLGSSSDLLAPTNELIDDDDEIHELKKLIVGEKIIDKEKLTAGTVMRIL